MNPNDDSLLNQIIASTAAQQRGGLDELLDVFLRGTSPEDVLDRDAADRIIDRYETQIHLQLEEILHHARFQELEALWGGLSFLVQRTDFLAEDKIILEVVTASKQEVRLDLQAGAEQSGLYSKVCQSVFTRPGETPYCVMLGCYEFAASESDVSTLVALAEVAMLGNCPLIGSVGPRFFGAEKWTEVSRVVGRRFERLDQLIASESHGAFRELQQHQAARYLGLIMPRFLLRPAYGEHRKVRSFPTFTETVDPEDRTGLCWGNPVVLFGAAFVEAVTRYGSSGGAGGLYETGQLDGMPIHLYRIAGRSHYLGPTELDPMDETAAQTLSDHGLIPVTSVLNQNTAVMGIARSLRFNVAHSKEAMDKVGDLLFVCRFMHYLRALVRDNLPPQAKIDEVRTAISEWLEETVCWDDGPSRATASRKPLKDFEFAVTEKDGRRLLELRIVVQSLLLPGEPTLWANSSVP